MKPLKAFALICLLLPHGVPTQAAPGKLFDVAILNGRVMDPETGLDRVANVGINGDRIEKITAEPISGIDTIDASGLVVAPGFIDYHWHGLDPLTARLAVRDGLTTAMDLECGALNAGQWYDARAGKMPFNYGTTVGQALARALVHDREEAQLVVDFDSPVDVLALSAIVRAAASDGVPGWSETISTPDQVSQLNRIYDENLRQGALGLGSVVGYMRKGVSTWEQYLAQQAAARYGRTTAVHGRFYPGAPHAAHPLGFDEVFANAVVLGAPLLYQHNVDHGWYEIEQKLAAAREQGLNMYSEMYPFVGASTVISAEFLQPETYEATGNRYGNSPEEGGIYDPQLDRFYSKGQFMEARETDPGRFVFIFYPARKDWIQHWIKTPGMFVAADGMPTAGVTSRDVPFGAYVGHPRTAGTRGKTLRLARENDVPLMQVLANASYLPARHLGDAGLIAMQQRGRVQGGMVADITIIDPGSVTDNATYRQGEQGLPTTGIPFVIVSGEVVVRNSVVQPVFAGKPMRYPVEARGRFEPAYNASFGM